MEKNGISFDLLGVGQILSNNQLSVPLYQRSYSWQEEQVTEFFKDLENALDSSEPSYFLGTIVLTRKARVSDDIREEFEIIDGQQRLSTTALLYIAIRNMYMSEGCEIDATNLGQKFLFEYDFVASVSEPRLKLNSDDNGLFQDLINVPDFTPPEKMKHSQQLMLEAETILTENLNRYVNTPEEGWRERVGRWISFLEKNVSVVTIIARDESDAYLIFETLNDRGADLTITDLLKNYLLGKSEGRIDEVRNNWILSMGVLDLTGNKSEFKDFLRRYWSSKYGTTRERELYKSIKSNILSSQQAFEFSNEMVRAAECYSALQSADNDYWVSFNPNPKQYVEALSILGAEQIIPLLLAAMQYFPPKEIHKLLSKAVNWSYRLIILRRSGSGSVEAAYCKAAVDIRKGSIKNTNDVKAALSDILPSDDEFFDAFKMARITKDKIARYTMRQIEDELQKKKNNSPELVTNTEASKVNLEHILPKSSSQEDWPSFTDDEKGAYAYRIGNMTLLSSKTNRKQASKPWSEKVNAYKQSELVLNRDIIKCKEWGPEEIDKRQAQLAKIALRIWKL